MLLNAQGRSAEAFDLLQSWNDTQPYNPESHVELAWLQRETGNLSAAENTLQQALQVDPTHPLATAHLGQLYQDAGQTDRAAALYQKSLYSNWFQPDVKSRLAALQGSTTAGRQSAYATAVPPYAQHPATAARYGQAQQVARMYPLPTYSQVGGTVVASQPAVVMSPQAQLGSPMINGDPAHVPQLSSDLPVVQPH
jgi:tetratricopeptide (TPR) repeat protein